VVHQWPLIFKVVHPSPCAPHHLIGGFLGNALALYGATSFDHGGFAVSLDGATPIRLNGSASDIRPDTLLVCQIACLQA
jgi:hypothetical protein